MIETEEVKKKKEVIAQFMKDNPILTPNYDSNISQFLPLSFVSATLSKWNDPKVNSVYLFDYINSLYNMKLKFLETNSEAAFLEKFYLNFDAIEKYKEEKKIISNKNPLTPK